jgi:hypothetical protein
MYEELDLYSAGNPFAVNVTQVRFLVQDWRCMCTTWPIVIAVGTWDAEYEVWRTEAQHVRKCGKCKTYPVRPN